MKEVLTNGIRTRVTLVGFVEVRLLGLITPKINLIKSSIAVFLVAVTLGLTTAYQVITKSYNTVLEIVEPRSGEEIQAVLFGKTDNECLKIIDGYWNRKNLMISFNYFIGLISLMLYQK